MVCQRPGQSLLIGSSNHPLRGQAALSSDELKGYPSVALPLGTAPLLMSALNQHSLGSDAHNSRSYSEEAWEGFASRGMALSHAAPFKLPELRERRNLEALNDDLTITEWLAVVGNRDVIRDSCFAHHFKVIKADVSSMQSVALINTDNLQLSSLLLGQIALNQQAALQPHSRRPLQPHHRHRALQGQQGRRCQSQGT